MESRRPRSSSRYRSTSRSSSTRRPSLSRKLSSSSQTPTTATISADEEEYDAIPTVKANLDNTLPLEFFREDILVVLKQLKIHKWYKITDSTKVSQIEVIRISGALTNSIYKIQLEGYPSLLLRIYGKNVDSIIDRDSELKILTKLSKKKIGPKLLGIFTNGRFEQFLEGFITLNRLQIRDGNISSMIARRMKELHTNIDVDYAQMQISGLPTCWNLIYKWLSICDHIIDSHVKSNGKAEENFFIVKFDKYKKLIEIYKNWLFEKYTKEELVTRLRFCHNDTQYGNLLLYKKSIPTEANDPVSDNNNGNKELKNHQNLAVIDFEYSGPNFPAFDIVNHFSEWMADYHSSESYFLDEKNYPTEEEILNLIKAYVEYDFRIPETFKSSNSRLSSMNQLTTHFNNEVKNLYNECISWRSCVQIFWSLWAVIQNGPVKNNEKAGEVIIENGPTSKYFIRDDLINSPQSPSMEPPSNATIQDQGESSDAEDNFLDDEFDYTRYCQQKAGLFIGDMIGLGLIDESYVDEEFRQHIKYLNTKCIS